jgi:hypothetical protein
MTYDLLASRGAGQCPQGGPAACQDARSRICSGSARLGRAGSPTVIGSAASRPEGRIPHIALAGNR